MRRHLVAALATLAVVAGIPGTAMAQPADGARIFTERCATCHGASDSRAPALETKRARTPQAVLESLMTGAMRPQGARLSGAERRAVAAFVGGRTIDGDVTGATTGLCPDNRCR